MEQEKNRLADDAAVAAENSRIREEYQRRRQHIPADLYALWQPAAALAHGERIQVAASLLQKSHVFPTPQSRILEVGVGQMGWLPDLLAMGASSTHMAGIDLDEKRIEQAQKILPSADLHVGDASQMGFADQSFDLVVCSTVLSSILDDTVRNKVAREIVRVLKPRGALLWYDFFRPNPWNRAVRPVSAHDVKRLFAPLAGDMSSITLAPPLARRIAPKSFLVAQALSAVPFLRTHLLGVLVKP